MTSIFVSKFIISGEVFFFESFLPKFLNIVLKGNFKKGIGNVEFKDITFDYKKMILDKIVLGKRKIIPIVKTEINNA